MLSCLCVCVCALVCVYYCVFMSCVWVINLLRIIGASGQSWGITHFLFYSYLFILLFFFFFHFPPFLSHFHGLSCLSPSHPTSASLLAPSPLRPRPTHPPLMLADGRLIIQLQGCRSCRRLPAHYGGRGEGASRRRSRPLSVAAAAASALGGNC